MNSLLRIQKMLHIEVEAFIQNEVLILNQNQLYKILIEINT